MRRNDRWKTVLQYTMGIAVLALCVAAAMFLPEQYAQWSDEQKLGKVTLSNRDTIEFLNAQQLDIEERLQKIYFAQDFYFVESIEFYPSLYFDSEMELLERCVRLTTKWCDAGLLPEQCETMARGLEKAMKEGTDEYVISLDVAGWVGMNSGASEEMMIPMFLITIEDIEDWERLSLVMDSEVELLYCAVYNGAGAESQITKELGYGTVEEAEQYLENHGRLDEPSIAPRKIDFAQAFGAKSAQAEETPKEFNVTAKLTFDTFEADAIRCLVTGDYAGFGIAAVYDGQKGWRFLDQLFSLLYGSNVEVISTEEFLYLTSNETSEGLSDAEALEEYRAEDENIAADEK